MIFFSSTCNILIYTYIYYKHGSIPVQRTSNVTWKKKSLWMNTVNSKRNVNQRRHSSGPFLSCKQWSKRITSGEKKENYGRRSLSRGILKLNASRLFALELTSDGTKKKKIKPTTLNHNNFQCTHTYTLLLPLHYRYHGGGMKRFITSASSLEKKNSVIVLSHLNVVLLYYCIIYVSILLYALWGHGLRNMSVYPWKRRSVHRKMAHGVYILLL